MVLLNIFTSDSGYFGDAILGDLDFLIPCHQHHQHTWPWHPHFARIHHMVSNVKWSTAKSPHDTIGI